MARIPGSVRTRTAVGATLVVAVALVAAGIAVVGVLRANLYGQAELQAAVAAREVASLISGGTAPGDLDLDDDEPLQVVAADGRVLAASDALEGRAPIAAFNRPGSSDADGDGGGAGSDDDDDDDHAWDDDFLAPLPEGGAGGSGRREPSSGEISPETEHGTADLATEEDEHAKPFRIAAVQVAAPAGEVVTVYAAAPLEGEEQAVGDVTRAMLTGLPLLLAVVAAVTWLVTRRALRPVEAIRAELAAIAVGGGGRAGDLSRRVPEPGSRDEVARLARTTNETLAVLEESVGRQRRFVADASHELRSPIASLRTQLEVAAAHPGLLDADEVLADVVRLQHLAADLLLLARLDAGDDVAGTRVDLAALVREDVCERVPRDRLPVAVDAEAGMDAEVRGSRSRLARVLGNLLDNAQRHAGDAVTVSLRRQEEQVVLAVADDGPGVPEGERERIFERFVRLDGARSRDEGGAGLGLAIARDVVARYGGTLTVGEAPGGGARFEVRLPAAGPVRARVRDRAVGDGDRAGQGNGDAGGDAGSGAAGRAAER